MSELPVRVLSRAGAGARPEEAASPVATAPLFERPIRSSIAAPALASPATLVRVQFPRAGARFALHSLVLRGEDGADLYRWAGAGDLFRQARDVRTERCGKAVVVECLSDATELEIELDPRLSSRAITAFVTVSAAAQGEAAPAARTEGADDLAGLCRELADVAESLRAIRDDVAASQSQLTAHRQWLERQFEIERRRSDMQAAMAEMQYRALTKRIGDYEEAQRQLESVYGSASWRLTRPLRGAARVMRGDIPAGQAARRVFLALLRRAPLRPELKARLRERFTPGAAPAARPAAADGEAEKDGPAGPVAFPLPGRILTLPEVAGETPEPLNLTVSVVIPTLNAGDEFYWLLRKLRAQKGLKGVEIVVVDSGSSDGTDAMAEAFGATLVRIPNSEFSHSHARNLGADAARGDLFLFMVQDAYPVGDWWLHSLAKALVHPRNEAERLAAVSCAEFPRKDSELLYNAAIDTHYRFLGCWDKDRIGAYAGADHESLRAQGQVSDVACMMSREIFEAYRYQGRYAEDLILGVRLIKDGRRTGMLSSVKVVHSHNRKTGYYLRRVFVDVVFLTEVFPDFATPQARSFSGALLGADRLKQVVEAWRPALGVPAAASLRALANKARDIKLSGRPPASPDDFGHAPIRPWFERVVAEEGQAGLTDAEQVRTMFVDRIEHTAAFVEAVFTEVDEHLAEELVATAQKTLAMSLGAQLAYIYLHNRPNAAGAEAERLDALRDILLAGI
ncbi:glycosyltransferase family 2 protein [Phenylobacterium terrae]|uniref:Glycosyltransferase family 2 protein n=1 Tax=Phenylobacterium terrae TaxID=2665495 RepID=A0ABW4N0M0_9CAUL